MIDVTPQYVSVDDFLNYWNVDLRGNLRSGANPSNKGELFLKWTEDRLMAWIDANTFRNVPWDNLKDDYNDYRSERERKYGEEQKQWWKKAILAQAYYVFKNSNITMDSGYDPEKGIVATYEDLEKIEICRAAIDFIKKAGLYNHVVDNRYRYTSFH